MGAEKYCYSLKYCCMFLIILLFSEFPSLSQTFTRQCISSYGMTSGSGELFFEQTAGQPYNTVPVHDKGSTFLPGFQQRTFQVKEIKLPSSLPELQVSVFPNPSSGNINIESKEQLEDVTIIITDISGRLMKSENNICLVNHSINCSTFPDGVYFITIYCQSFIKKTVRLLINKK